MQFSTRKSLIPALMMIGFISASPSAFAKSYPYLTVKIHQQTNFTSKHKAKLDAAILIFEKVVNSSEFQERVLNFETKSKKNGRTVSTPGFVQAKDYTNEQLLDLIYSGTEDFYKEPKYNPPVGNSIADFFLRIYKGKRGVVGYTNKGYRRINLNSYYYNQYSVEYITGNLIHEWMHKLGFSHDSKSTSRRPYSVPYGIGGIMRDLAKTLE